MSEDTELIMKRRSGSGRETVLAVITAMAVLAACLFVTTVIPVFDLGILGKSLESLFHVAFVAEGTLPAQADYGSSGLEQETMRAISHAENTLFVSPDTLNDDRPILQPITAAPLRAEPRLEPDRVAQQDFSEPLRDVEDNLSVGELAIVMPEASRRKASAFADLGTPDPGKLYETGRESGGGPGRPGGEEHRPEFMPPEETEPLATTPPTPASATLADAESGASYSQNLLQPDRPGHYPSLDNDVRAVFTVYREPGTEKKYFRLEISLRDDSSLETLPKDVLFLVDTSRSISRRELDQVRAAILQYLSELPSQDRWNISVFDETSSYFSRDFLDSSAFEENRDQVSRFITKQSNSMRTNIFAATGNLLSSLPGTTRPCNVFLISDAETTAGTDSVKQIVQGLARVNRNRFSIFTYNAGEGGNRYLLQLLSYRSRGAQRDCPNIGDVRHNLVDFFRTYNAPVLANPVLNYNNLSHEEIYPGVLSCLYRSTPIVVYGRAYTGDHITLRIAGMGATGPREVFFQATVSGGETDHPELASQWAQGKAHALMATLADNPENTEIRQAIEALANRYNLRSTLEMIEGSQNTSSIRKLLSF